MKKKLASAKKFYLRNERRILITTTVAVTSVAVLMRVGIKQHNDFLKEHDLYDMFYTQED